MPDYEPVLDRITAQTGTEFRPASDADLAALRGLGVPDSVLSFFARHEPSGCAEGQSRLWPIEYVLRENRDLIPGVYVAPLGYVVFATTYCGDAYCFDVKAVGPDGEPRVVLISHEATAVRKGMTAADATRLAKPVAENLLDFLEKLERSELDEDCVY